MNYIKHLTGFFDRIIQDHNLNPTHISLYIALFQQWNINRFHNPISITRDEMMQISKIGSRATYHKCMRELHDKGYIKYIPSYNPFKGSMVVLFSFSEESNLEDKIEPFKKICATNELVLNKLDASNYIGSEQALVSSLNNINFINNTNLETKQKKIKKNNLQCYQNEVDYTEGKNCRKKENVNNKNTPSLNQVTNYFINQNAPEIEAQKFFNYFSSINWLVGGKTPMTNWKAAANNWVLNKDKYNHIKQNSNNIFTNNFKNYSEPL